jgi:hypothetical protein
MNFVNTTYHQRGESSMPNPLLPYKYEEAKTSANLSGFAGLPVFLDFLHSLRFDRALRQSLDTAEPADCLWKPSAIVTNLLLLNLAGGDNVDDLRRIQADPGMSRLLEKFYETGLNAPALRKYRELKRRQAAGSVPAASTVFRFLKQDGVIGLEGRGQGKAYIPVPGQTAEQLCACNTQLISALCANRAYDSITLDADATLIETHKRDALYSYKGFAAYQPLNVWWAEQRVMLYTEFRDGNVPADYPLKPVMERTLSCLPKTDKPVFFRSDTAGYQIDLLKFCDDSKIQFAVGCPISKEFRKAVRELPNYAWRKLDAKHQYAEVCFVPSSLATTKARRYGFRYLAMRESMQEQLTLFDTPESEYPFPVIELNGNRYKIHALVSNRDIAAAEVIKWYYKRCGNSEEAHAILKNDLAGGILPCNHYHANAAWWWIAVLAHNIHSAFKMLCCDESLQTSRLKWIRFHIINIPGLVLEHGRRLIVRLNAGESAYGLLSGIRQAISGLRPCPG